MAPILAQPHLWRSVPGGLPLARGDPPGSKR